MPNLRPDQSIDAPLIIEWNQNDAKHSFSCCVGKATLDLKAYSDALYFPEEAILNDLLQSVQVCYTEHQGENVLSQSALLSNARFDWQLTV